MANGNMTHSLTGQPAQSLWKSMNPDKKDTTSKMKELIEVDPQGKYEVGDLLVIDPDSPYLVLSISAIEASRKSSSLTVAFYLWLPEHGRFAL